MKLRYTIVCACALTACTVGPNFKPPPPLAARDWHSLAAQPDNAVSESSDPDPLWWNSFGDPTLTALMNLAIAGNPSLREAVLRVVEAQQNVTNAAAAGLPTLSGNASYMREQLGVKGILESDGAYTELNSLADADSPINTLVPGIGSTLSNSGTSALNSIAQPINLYQYSLSSSWELDLFGRVRRSVEQARATTQAQEDAANDALVMLESQVAQAYFGLRSAQELATQQQDEVHIAEQSLRLTQDRQLRGLTSDLDVEQANAQLLSVQAQTETYQKQAAQAIDQINVLLGEPPGTLDARLAPALALPPPPSLIGIGLPSTLARRRPDIREAEAQLHAATANVGVAVASFYPDISLTGNLGFRATDASYLTNWASNFYSAGPSISLPIFEGGQLAANLRTARAGQASAALNYRSTVLNALREVEDDIVAYRSDQIAETQTAGAVQSGALSYYLSNNRYVHGLSSYLQVLDAERTLVSARQQLLQSELMVDNDVVTLYTALGGGWQSAAEAIPQQHVPIAPPPLPAAVDSLAAANN